MGLSTANILTIAICFFHIRFIWDSFNSFLIDTRNRFGKGGARSSGASGCVKSAREAGSWSYYWGKLWVLFNNNSNIVQTAILPTSWCEPSLFANPTNGLPKPWIFLPKGIYRATRRFNTTPHHPNHQHPVFPTSQLVYPNHESFYRGPLNRFIQQT